MYTFLGKLRLELLKWSASIMLTKIHFVILIQKKKKQPLALLHLKGKEGPAHWTHRKWGKRWWVNFIFASSNVSNRGQNHSFLQTDAWLRAVPSASDLSILPPTRTKKKKKMHAFDLLEHFKQKRFHKQQTVELHVKISVSRVIIYWIENIRDSRKPFDLSLCFFLN